MAKRRVTLVAQEADTARPRRRRLGEGGQFVELFLRFGGVEMVLEDAQHLGGTAAARRDPALLRGTDLWKLG